MGLTELLCDLYASISFTEAYADAPGPEGKDGEDQQEEGEEEKSEEGGEAKEESEEGEGGEGGGGEEGGDDAGVEEEEEEEEEPEDPKPKLEEECARSAQCAPLKHHYDECAERVTRQHEDPNHKGPKEDCVEEFFHLSHCATQCAAPKLFKMLK